MRTTFHTREPFAGIFLSIAREMPCASPVRPLRFMEKMRTNTGSFSAGLDADGLQRKNPVIVGLGDSVTAGHFENLILTLEDLQRKEAESGGNISNFEITDARQSYLEKFRYKLIDKYENTSVSVINAGIAGDNLIGMSRRLDRDVIRYQPDLVLINGSLNWDAALGTADDYKELLREQIQRIRVETEADIILLTPNGDIPHTTFLGDMAPIPTTPERVIKIRELAAEEQVCLADVYAVWEAARDVGCPWIELLANRANHPGVEGHEVYAITLMKLFED